MTKQINISKTLLLHQTKAVIALCVLQKIEKKYRYFDFVSLSELERESLIQTAWQDVFAEKPLNKLVLQEINTDAKVFNFEKKYDQTIQLIESTLLGNNQASATEILSLTSAYIFTKQFEKTIALIKKFNNVAVNDLPIQLNLAHAFMFSNNLEEAKNIHKKFKLQNVNAIQTWKNKTINDFSEFEQAQLPNNHFAKILRIVE